MVPGLRIMASLGNLVITILRMAANSGLSISPENRAGLHPLGFEHINFHGSQAGPLRIDSSYTARLTWSRRPVRCNGAC